MHKFTDKQIKELHEVLKQSKNKGCYQRILAVWLRAKFNMKSQEVAQAIGWSIHSVRQVQSRFFKEGIKLFNGQGSGGRRNECLSLNEEKEFLKPFLKAANNAEILVVSEIKNAYEKCINKKVSPSTIYRILARHGWRKITPRPSHPKANFTLQNEFKKTL